MKENKPWPKRYFKAKKRFDKAISEFEGDLLEVIPEEFSEHVDAMLYTLSRLRIDLRILTDFVSTVYELDKMYGDDEE